MRSRMGEILDIIRIHHRIMSHTLPLSVKLDSQLWELSNSGSRCSWAQVMAIASVESIIERDIRHG